MKRMIRIGFPWLNNQGEVVFQPLGSRLATPIVLYEFDLGSVLKETHVRLWSFPKNKHIHYQLQRHCGVYPLSKYDYIVRYIDDPKVGPRVDLTPAAAPIWSASEPRKQVILKKVTEVVEPLGRGFTLKDMP